MGRPKAKKSSNVTKPVVNEKKARGKRYTGEEKAKILEQALAEIGQGGQITKIADKLGVTFFTLKSWLKGTGQVAKGRSKKASAKRSRKSSKSSDNAVVAVESAGVSKTAEATPAPAAAKRGRKPGKSAAAVEVESATPLKDLERKLEELTLRYTNLAHLYGELVSKYGSTKI